MRTEDVFLALDQHLKLQNEPELLLLKGHLILEQCLNELLSTYVAKPEAIDRMNLSFSRKLDLLVAFGHGLYVPGAGADGEKLIREINRIRNKLAHQLNFEGLDLELKQWACRVQGFTPKTIDRRATYLNTVKRAFSFAAAFMSGVAEGAHYARSRR